MAHELALTTHCHLRIIHHSSPIFHYLSVIAHHSSLFCSLLITHHSPLITHQSLLIMPCSSLITHYIIHRSSLMPHYSLPSIHYPILIRPCSCVLTKNDRCMIFLSKWWHNIAFNQYRRSVSGGDGIWGLRSEWWAMSYDDDYWAWVMSNGNT